MGCTNSTNSTKSTDSINITEYMANTIVSQIYFHHKFAPHCNNNCKFLINHIYTYTELFYNTNTYDIYHNFETKKHYCFSLKYDKINSNNEIEYTGEKRNCKKISSNFLSNKFFISLKNKTELLFNDLFTTINHNLLTTSTIVNKINNNHHCQNPLKNLPDSLKIIKFGPNHICVESLPINLEKIHLGMETFFTSNRIIIPKNVKNLSFYVNTANFSCDMIPINIKKLKIQSGHALYRNYTFNLNIKLLQLQHLDIANYSISVDWNLKILTPNLKKLTTNFDNKFFNNLPHSLETIVFINNTPKKYIINNIKNLVIYDFNFPISLCLIQLVNYENITFTKIPFNCNVKYI